MAVNNRDSGNKWTFLTRLSSQCCLTTCGVEERGGGAAWFDAGDEQNEQTRNRKHLAETAGAADERGVLVRCYF
jgi:hypothetical protein